jgi:hypothetical protein
MKHWSAEAEGLTFVYSRQQVGIIHCAAIAQGSLRRIMGGALRHRIHGHGREQIIAPGTGPHSQRHFM